MAKLYSNENFHRSVVLFLKNLGHDVLTTKEARRANQGIPDEDVLHFAISQNRIVLTFDRPDFIRLHRKNPTHSGIIACTEDTDSEALAQRIHAALLANNHRLDNQLLRIYRSAN